LSYNKSIVILTGAGISQESGLKTFRDSDGFWENNEIEKIANYKSFEENPSLVNEFYNERRKQLFDLNIVPNDAHFALADFEKKWNGDFLLVTQNVDNLHERAGSNKLIHLHGELLKARCYKISCKNNSRIIDWDGPISNNIFCEKCNSTYEIRPHVVWFGEQPLDLEKIYSSLKACEIFISIGTSGTVFPAADFINQVNTNCKTIEINISETKISKYFKENYFGTAASKVPEILKSLI